MNITLNQRYTLEAPTGTISDAGILLIQQYIQAQNPQEGDWKAQNPDNEVTYLYVLPYDWNWVWKIQDGEYRGTFPKRVRQYYHRQFELKAPNRFIEHIGNLAREHSESESRYNFEFVDDFGWNAGDFGDDDSCFWGGRTRARDLLKEHGAWAIRFYEDGEGKARAWVVPMEDGTFIVFNGYGFLGNPTLKIARVMAQFNGLQYKRIRLTNWGTDDMLIWVNSGIGYLIGTQEQIATVSSHNFQWGEPGEDESY